MSRWLHMSIAAHALGYRTAFQLRLRCLNWHVQFHKRPVRMQYRQGQWYVDATELPRMVAMRGTRLRRHVTRRMRRAVVERAGHCCERCGLRLVRALQQVDHVVPLHQFGSNHHSNLQLLCANCHALKSDAERTRNNIEQVRNHSVFYADYSSARRNAGSLTAFV